MRTVARHRTAMKRAPLFPARLTKASTHGVLTPTSSFFDYGCGRGDDVARLSAQGFNASGWDPAYQPAAERTPADVVNLGYVVNVIEDPAERADALTQAWGARPTDPDCLGPEWRMSWRISSRSLAMGMLHRGQPFRSSIRSTN